MEFNIPAPKLVNFLTKEELSKTITAFSERAKKLSKARVSIVVYYNKPFNYHCPFRKIRLKLCAMKFVKTVLMRYPESLKSSKLNLCHLVIP